MARVGQRFQDRSLRRSSRDAKALAPRLWISLAVGRCCIARFSRLRPPSLTIHARCLAFRSPRLRCVEDRVYSTLGLVWLELVAAALSASVEGQVASGGGNGWDCLERDVTPIASHPGLQTGGSGDPWISQEGGVRMTSEAPLRPNRSNHYRYLAPFPSPILGHRYRSAMCRWESIQDQIM